MPDSEGFSKRPQEKLKQRSTHRSWRKYMAHLKGPHGKTRAGYRERERHNLGHMPLVGSVCGVLWG